MSFQEHMPDEMPRFVNLAILTIMAVVCAIADALIEQKKYPENAYWLFDDNRSSDNPHINGIVTFANALITYARSSTDVPTVLTVPQLPEYYSHLAVPLYGVCTDCAGGIHLL
jgi:hypothetical protein